MANAQPDLWTGRQSIVLVFRHDEKDVWHQGEFATGASAGLKTRYAFCNLVANGLKIWQPIPDDVRWLLFLPHPAKGAIVRVVEGEYAGETGHVVDTHPPTAHLSVQTGKQTVDVAAADVEFMRE
jgi:hypothetical protein